MPAASNRRRPAFTLSGSPSSSMSCGRERMSLSKSVTPFGGRRPARYRSTIWFLMMNSRSMAGAGVPGADSAGGRCLVHTRGFDTTRSFHRGSKFRRFRDERTARLSPTDAHAPQKSQAPLGLVSAVGPTGSHPLMLRFLCPEAAAPLHIPRMGSRPSCDVVRSLPLAPAPSPPACAATVSVHVHSIEVRQSMRKFRSPLAVAVSPPAWASPRMPRPRPTPKPPSPSTAPRSRARSRPSSTGRSRGRACPTRWRCRDTRWCATIAT